MKLETGQRLEVLGQIRDHGPSSGAEIVVRETAEITSPAVNVILSRLQADGLLTSRAGVYSLTRLGKVRLIATMAARASYAAVEESMA